MELGDPEYWNPSRQDLRSWFKRSAPSLGELYEGALRMIFSEEFPGRALEQTKEPIPAEILDRLKQLWEQRLAIAKTAEQSSEFEKEIAVFGWWFVSEKFEE